MDEQSNTATGRLYTSAFAKDFRPQDDDKGWTYGMAWVCADGTALHFQVSVVPEPGTVCLACHEKTPNAHALEMRKFRAKRKAAERG